MDMLHGYATTWISLENTMFSEKKGRTKRPHLYETFRKSKSIEAESRSILEWAILTYRFLLSML